ncbi:hypothetical protein [Bacillus massiliglaciei]|uniref:hypothetical protein n=1 Tax=Bacillus massiliglaciei TaxID=1816693 RepID=UPI0018FF1073|nr:hypothetical protein [Bacillus massiliglaciei]
MEEKRGYRNPGAGAVEFASQFTINLSEVQALPVIADILAGKLYDIADKRIKRCGWCAYPYRDKTKPNNSKTCSPGCKYAKDNFAKAVKKAETALTNPKPMSFERNQYTYYADHLEYPFYLSEHYMLKRAHRWESPFSPDKLALIDAATQRGYKRKSAGTPTDGSGRVFVKGLGHKHAYGPVGVSRLEEGYFKSKYSERHLQLERRRAEHFRRSKKEYI